MLLFILSSVMMFFSIKDMSATGVMVSGLFMLVGFMMINDDIDDAGCD